MYLIVFIFIFIYLFIYLIKKNCLNCLYFKYSCDPIIEGGNDII